MLLSLWGYFVPTMYGLPGHTNTLSLKGNPGSLPVRQEEQSFFLSECEIRGLSDSFGIQESPSTSGTDWSIIGPYRM